MIVSVDGSAVRGRPLQELRDLILGAPGSNISLSFMRGPNPQDPSSSTQNFSVQLMRGSPQYLASLSGPGPAPPASSPPVAVLASAAPASSSSQEHDKTNKFQVTVEGHTLNVESGTHICELKEMIKEETGISQRVHLVFGGRRLKCCSTGTPDGEGHSNPPAPCNKTCPTLQHYSIQSASILQLLVPM